ncbi:MAG: cytochrome P460 family protein [Candidatus Poribacteria bacterium]|nr:cytochrome P460 family protein [Candidatus Poribacteria bacterium]
MLKYQITLIAVLIGCVAFVACDRAQQVLEPVMPDPEPEMMDTGDMTGMMDMVMDMMAHKSWMSVDLPAPTMTVEEAAAAMNAAGTGQAHGTGIRTVYFNEAAAMANMAEGDKMYPVGSMIVKEVMNADNTEVVHVATMMKTDDMMYAERGGWIYGVGGNTLAIADSVGCDSCHAKAGAGNDYVFVSLSKMEDDGMDAGADTGMMDADKMDDGGTTDGGATDGGTTDDGTTDGGTA